MTAGRDFNPEIYMFKNSAAKTNKNDDDIFSDLEDLTNLNNYKGFEDIDSYLANLNTIGGFSPPGPTFTQGQYLMTSGEQDEVSPVTTVDASSTVMPLFHDPLLDFIDVSAMQFGNPLGFTDRFDSNLLDNGDQDIAVFNAIRDLLQKAPSPIQGQLLTTNNNAQPELPATTALVVSPITLDNSAGISHADNLNPNGGESRGRGRARSEHSLTDRRTRNLASSRKSRENKKRYIASMEEEFKAYSGMVDVLKKNIVEKNAELVANKDEYTNLLYIFQSSGLQSQYPMPNTLEFQAPVGGVNQQIVDHDMTNPDQAAANQSKKGRKFKYHDFAKKD